LGLAIKKEYNIVVNRDQQEARKHFASVKSQVEFVTADRK
jgi:hypothetical protein